jgi:HPt (histidine-containing phosphotransfer) domain-containing protein
VALFPGPGRRPNLSRDLADFDRNQECFMDLGHLIQEVGNDQALAKKICHIFLRNCSTDIQALRQAVQKRESSDAFRIVHSFKYIIGLIGAKEAFDTILSMEDQINSTRWHAVDDQLAHFSCMTKQISEAMHCYLNGTTKEHETN